MPDNTSDLVALTQFLENASSVTVVNLQTAVDEAGERLLFLLEYATLPCMLAFFTLLIWYFLTYSVVEHLYLWPVDVRMFDSCGKNFYFHSRQCHLLNKKQAFSIIIGLFLCYIYSCGTVTFI